MKDCEKNLNRDMFTLSQNSHRLLERKNNIAAELEKRNTDSTQDQSSYPQPNVNDNSSINQAHGSLLDDFADTSTEMMDIGGGDD